MTKVNENSEKATIVNGVVLTKKAISRLAVLQEHNNDQLDDSSRIIADAICFIANYLDDVDSTETTEANRLMNELAIIRKEFNDLAKP